MSILVNGQLQQAPALEPALLGHGCFTTMQFSNHGQTIPFKEQHLKRLVDTSAFLGIPWALHFPDIAMLATHHNLSEGIVKITVIKGHTITTIRPLPKPQSVTLLAVQGYSPPLCLAQHKTISYAGYTLAKQHAQQQGYDHALLCDDDGLPLEADHANIFLEKDGKLYTPPAHKALLPGIMRSHIMETQNAIEEEIPWQDADRVFLTNAARGVIEVKQIYTRVCHQIE